MQTNVIPMESPQVSGDKYVNAFVNYVRTHGYPEMGDEDWRFECDVDNISCERLENTPNNNVLVSVMWANGSPFDGGYYYKETNGYDSWYTLKIDSHYYRFSGGLDNEPDEALIKSKAIQQFNEWYDEISVPLEVLNALEEEAEAIDKVMVDRYYWLYRKGVDSCLYYAQALASIIGEHESAERERAKV